MEVSSSNSGQKFELCELQFGRNGESQFPKYLAGHRGTHAPTRHILGILDYVPALADRAPVVTPEQFNFIREHVNLGTIAFTSGGFAPGHPGHYELVKESKIHHGDTVVVCVNGDNFLRAKHGINFMDLETRAQVMSYITGADFIVPFEIEGDTSMNVPLKQLKPHIFTKGGDRNAGNIPETPTCEAFGINLVSGVGGDFKMASSSDFLRHFAAYVRAHPNTFQTYETAWLTGSLPPGTLKSDLLDPAMKELDLGKVLQSVDGRRFCHYLSKGKNHLGYISSTTELAPIMSYAEFLEMRHHVNIGKVAVVAGEFSPITPLELQQLHAAKEQADTVVALVARDEQLARRHEGAVFMDLPMRLQSLSYVRGIDFVVAAPLSSDRDFEETENLFSDDSFSRIKESESEVTGRSLMLRFAEFVRSNPKTFV